MVNSGEETVMGLFKKKKVGEKEVPQKPIPFKLLYGAACCVFSVGVIGIIWSYVLTFNQLNYGQHLSTLSSIISQMIFSTLFGFLWKVTPSLKDSKPMTDAELQALVDETMKTTPSVPTKNINTDNTYKESNDTMKGGK